jgi:hypothetical protein
VSLRGPDIFDFEAKETISGTQFGVLSVPRLARTDLRILDGQHRILGVQLAIDGIAKELEKERSSPSSSRSSRLTWRAPSTRTASG